MTTQPKFTVIIPTRERADVLEKSLRTATSQNYERLEIIVSDNCSEDHTRDVVMGAKDARVRYVNPGKRISMAEHWEFALSHVEDGWVTIIGDDDGLIPGAPNRVARIIAETGVRAVRAVRSYYTWPQLLNRSYGKLRVPVGRGYEIRNTATWRAKLMRGEASYVDLPMLYDGGFVDLTVIQEMRARTGRIYHSVAPDIYSALAISSILDRYAYCHEPLAIAGMSAHSTGVSMWKGAKDTAAPIQKFNSEKNLPYHKDIPLAPDGGYPRTNHALVYEAFLQSAPLRPAMAGNIHAQQLEVILALAKHEADVHEWGHLFANMHGLDFDAIAQRARLRKLRIRVGDFAKKFRSTLNEVVVSTEELPVADVYEASIAASAIREAHPGAMLRLRELAKTVQRVARR